MARVRPGGRASADSECPLPSDWRPSAATAPRAGRRCRATAARSMSSSTSTVSRRPARCVWRTRRIERPDLHPGVRRPTLGLCRMAARAEPAGPTGSPSAIADRAGPASFIDEALRPSPRCRARRVGRARPRAAHWPLGGGAALALPLQDLPMIWRGRRGARSATYSTSASPADDGWARVLARDARAVAARGASERARYAEHGAGLRIYIAGSWTDPVARRTEGLITEGAGGARPRSRAAALAASLLSRPERRRSANASPRCRRAGVRRPASRGRRRRPRARRVRYSAGRRRHRLTTGGSSPCPN